MTGNVQIPFDIAGHDCLCTQVPHSWFNSLCVAMSSYFVPLRP